MDRESSNIANKFLEEFGDEFETEDISNLKKVFKNLNVVLENKDDLKKAIEFLKDSRSITEEQAAELQQAAEETRVFRDKMSQAVGNIERDIRSISEYSEKLSKLQQDRWDATLKTQQGLMEMGEKVNSGVFAQAFSSHIVKSFTENRNFTKLFGESKGVQSLSTGISGMFKAFGQLKEGISLIRKGPAKDAFEAKKKITEMEKERNHILQQLSLARERKERLENVYGKGSKEAKDQETEIQKWEGLYRGVAKTLSKSIAKVSVALEAQILGSKFEEWHGPYGGEKANLLTARSEEGHNKKLLESASISSNSGNEKKVGDLIHTSEGETFATDPEDNVLAMKAGGPLQRMFAASGAESTKIEKTKTPESYPQIMGALALWLEEELKDKDEEPGGSKVGAAVAGGAAGFSIINTLRTMKDIMRGFGGKINEVGRAISRFGKSVTNHLGRFGKAIGSKITQFGNSIRAAGAKMARAASNIGSKISKFASGIGKSVSKLGPNISKFVSKIGPQIGKASKILRFGALRAAGTVASLAEGAYRGWQIGTAIGDIMDAKAFQKEIVKQNEEGIRYAEGDDKTKKSMYEDIQKRHFENEKKLKAYEEEKVKLTAALNAARKSGDSNARDRLTKQLGELNSGEENLKKLQERDSIFLTVHENAYKKLMTASKSEIEMKRNAANSDKSSGNSDVVAAVTDLKNELTSIVGAGTAYGLNNA